MQFQTTLQDEIYSVMRSEHVHRVRALQVALLGRME